MIEVNNEVFDAVVLAKSLKPIFSAIVEPPTTGYWDNERCLVGKCYKDYDGEWHYFLQIDLAVQNVTVDLVVD